jgi:hypothetical protein
MRAHAAGLAAIVLAGTVTSAGAQDRFRLSTSVGQQVTSTPFREEQPFREYLEQGAFTFERTISKRLFYDAGLAVRLVGGLYAGATFSFFSDTGAGAVVARVPHPFFFNQPRTVTGEVRNAKRTEIGEHLQLSWTAPAGNLEFTFFGGPSMFTTEQLLVTRLSLSLNEEVYPYDTLSFPGATTETLKENVFGYNAGVDMNWRFAPRVGLGILIRYAHGSKDFIPTGGQPVKVETGGLHAGGGLRLTF